MSRSKCVAALITVLMAAGPALAETKAISSIPWPGAVSGPGKSWDRDARFGNLEKYCARGDKAMGERIRDHAAKAAALTDPTDRKNAIAYMAAVQKEYDAQQVGIPGFGTYAELTARRDKELAEIKASFPTGNPKTPDEFKATAEGYAKFRARATAAVALSEKLRSVSPCLNESGDWNEIWYRLTPENIENQIGQHAGPIGNNLMGGYDRIMINVDQFMATQAKPPADVDAVAETTRVAVSLYHQLGELEPGIALAPLWMEYFHPSAKQKVKDAPAKVAEMRAATLAIAQKYLPMVKPPASKKEAANEKVFRTFHKKAFPAEKLVAVRALPSRKSDMFTVDRGVKFRRVYKSFLAYYVTPLTQELGPLPGFENKDLCELHWISFSFYEKGMFVQLKRWEVMRQPGLLSPMLCKNAKGSF